MLLPSVHCCGKLWENLGKTWGKAVNFRKIEKFRNLERLAEVRSWLALFLPICAILLNPEVRGCCVGVVRVMEDHGGHRTRQRIGFGCGSAKTARLIRDGVLAVGAGEGMGSDRAEGCQEDRQNWWGLRVDVR